MMYLIFITTAISIVLPDTLPFFTLDWQHNAGVWGIEVRNHKGKVRFEIIVNDSTGNELGWGISQLLELHGDTFIPAERLEPEELEYDATLTYLAPGKYQLCVKLLDETHEIVTTTKKTVYIRQPHVWIDSIIQRNGKVYVSWSCEVDSLPEGLFYSLQVIGYRDTLGFETTYPEYELYLDPGKYGVKVAIIDMWDRVLGESAVEHLEIK